MEEEPPALAPAIGTADQANVTLDEVDRVTITASTDATALLLLSQVNYPAWRAYVDGEATHVYTADGALQAVLVPAGAHTIEFRFESLTLSAGIAISIGTIVGLILPVLLVGLPHHQTGFSLTDADGARDARGDSIPQRLKVRALHQGDQIEPAGNRVHLGDHRIRKSHST